MAATEVRKETGTKSAAARNREIERFFERLDQVATPAPIVPSIPVQFIVVDNTDDDRYYYVPLPSELVGAQRW